MYVQRILKPLLALGVSIVFLAGCAGGGTSAITPPAERSILCGVPTNSATRSIQSLCGGGGAGVYGFNGIESGYSLFGRQNTVTDYDGYTTDSSGATKGTSTATITTDPNDGVVHAQVTDPTLSSSPVLVPYVNTHFLADGYNSLPNGITLYKNSMTNVAYATFTDPHGITWRGDGSVDADGTHIDISFSGSNGQQFSDKYPVSAWAPSFGTSVPLANGRHAMSIRHLDGAARVAVVAGVVAGVMGAFGAVAILIPGGQVVGATALTLAAAATAVAALAAAIDWNEKQKTGAKC